VTKPDEALLWARENMAKWCEENDEHQLAQTYRSGAEDIRLIDEVRGYRLIDEVRGYRAGAVASAERIKELEAENEAMQELAGRLQCEMSDTLTRLNERYPEEFVWLKEGDQ